MSAVHPQRSRHLRLLRSWPRVLRKDSAGRPSLVVETVLVVLLLTVYDKLKDLGAARRSSAIDHGFALLRLERHLHLAIEASANQWMSSHVLLGHVSSYFYEFAWGFVAIGALIVCWIRRPDLYRPARNAMLVINAVGLAIFFVDPTAPPRLLPGTAFRDTVAAAGFGTAHDGRLPGRRVRRHAVAAPWLVDLRRRADLPDDPQPGGARSRRGVPDRDRGRRRQQRQPLRDGRRRGHRRWRSSGVQ